MKIINSLKSVLNASCTISEFMAKILKLYSDGKFVKEYLQVEEPTSAQIRKL
jgi:hypothetical protein